ncbi:MAG: hypothetical protein ACI9N1_001549, partial [Flavobacteriales bacterium]
SGSNWLDRKDCYRYTSVNFRFDLLKARARYTAPVDDHTNYTPTPTPTPTPTQTLTPTPTGNKPLVNIYNPTNNNSTVTSPSFTIKAKVYHVNNATGIKFKQNGFNVSVFNYNSTTNEFVAQVMLNPGSNVFEITGTNSYGTDSDSKIIIFKQPESFTQLPAPVVTITNPNTSPTQVSQPNYTIVATVLNVAGKNNIGFKLNGNNLTNFTYNTSTKILSASINLVYGNNTVQVTGTNTVGSDSKTTIINYVRPQEVLPPVVTITNPAVNPYTTTSPVQNVNATVLNVNNSANISVLVNGGVINNFTFSTTSQKLSFSSNLIVGANIVQITGTNQAGSDSKSTTIIYQPSEVVALPVVDFIDPATSPFASLSSNITLKATVLNVPGHSGITVNQNGTNLTSFSYNATTKEVSFNATLIGGNNIFKITGTNASGSDDDSQTVTFKMIQTVQPPIVNIQVPNTNPHNTSINSQIVNAEILNVTNTNNVTTKLNGTTVTGFSFDPTTHKYGYQVALLQGANIIEITGTNSAGTATKSQTIIYTPVQAPCSTPVIVLTQPSVSAKSTVGSGASAPISINTTNSKGAIIGNISGAATVVFKINGQSSPGYNYNAQTGSFESMLHLTEGANSYEISATNNCGTVTQTITYIYAPVQACENPVIQMVTPATTPIDYNGNSQYTFSASVLNVVGGGSSSVTLNGKVVKIITDRTTGDISGSITLSEGTNKLVITATNACGTTTSEVVINHTLPQPPPVVTFITPSSFPHTASNGNMTVTANVTNVTSKNDIEVFDDGQAVANFKYSAATKNVMITLNLPPGSHTLTVKGTNNAGFDSKDAEIIVTQTGNPPVVGFTNIGSTSTANPHQAPDRMFKVFGSVSNFNGATVTLTIDGVASTKLVYDSSTGVFTVPLSFTQGGQVKQIIVTAVNSFGQDAEKGYVRFGTTALTIDENNNQTQYEDAIKSGDALMKTKSYDAAMLQYKKAAEFKPNEGYPKQKMTSITNIREQNKLNTEYSDHIKKADLYYSAGKYTTAKVYYQKAATVKPNEAYAKQRLADVEKKIKAASKPAVTPIKKPTESKTVKPTGSKTTTTKPTGTKTTTVKPTGKKTTIVKPTETVTPTTTTTRGGK